MCDGADAIVAVGVRCVCGWPARSDVSFGVGGVGVSLEVVLSAFRPRPRLSPAMLSLKVRCDDRDSNMTTNRIHDTGSSAIKMSMRAVNNTLSACEIYNTGARMRTYGYGLDAVQSYDLTVRDCYFHGAGRTSPFSPLPVRLLSVGGQSLH